MRKSFAFASIAVGLCICTLSSEDHLKSSLSKMIHEKDVTPAMVDLSRLDMPQTMPLKPRNSKTVIATVNGHNILKKEADEYLKSRTKGKVTDFDTLPKEQHKRLIAELSLPVLIAEKAKKELSEKEKEAVFVSMWMQKEAAKVTVTDAEVQAFYEQLKQKAIERNTTNSIIPPFDSIKNKMKSQMVEKKIMDKLMKDVKVEVAAPMIIPPMMLKQSANNIK